MSEFLLPKVKDIELTGEHLAAYEKVKRNPADNDFSYDRVSRSLIEDSLAAQCDQLGVAFERGDYQLYTQFDPHLNRYARLLFQRQHFFRMGLETLDVRGISCIDEYAAFLKRIVETRDALGEIGIDFPNTWGHFKSSDDHPIFRLYTDVYYYSDPMIALDGVSKIVEIIAEVGDQFENLKEFDLRH